MSYVVEEDRYVLYGRALTYTPKRVFYQSPDKQDVDYWKDRLVRLNTPFVLLHGTFGPFKQQEWAILANEDLTVKEGKVVEIVPPQEEHRGLDGPPLFDNADDLYYRATYDKGE